MPRLLTICAICTLGFTLITALSPFAARGQSYPYAPYSLVGDWCAVGGDEILMRITRDGKLIYPKETCRLKRIVPEDGGWFAVRWSCKSGDFSEHLRTIATWDDPPTIPRNRQLESRTMPSGHGHVTTFEDCSQD